MGVIKDYVNQGFTVGDITVSTFDETGARIRIKDFYDLDLIERQRIVNLAGKVDVELLGIENKITVETDDKFKEYYKSSEIDTKFYNKTDTDSKFYNKAETDSKLNTYATKSEISAGYVPKTLEAQETIKGITNFKDMKKQVNYLSGAEYKENNEFGSNLKNITAGEMYYYVNKPYMAIKTASSVSGFLAPDGTNFLSITNTNLNTRLNNLTSYFVSIPSVGFFIPNTLTDWWGVDLQANYLIITLEDPGITSNTFAVHLNTLRNGIVWQNYTNGKTFQILLSGSTLKIICPGASLKLLSAYFQ